MFKLILLIALVVSIGFESRVVAQDAGQRTKDLVAALDKTKYKKKEKANISVEVYVDVKNDPIAKANPAEYSGFYEADGYRLELSVRGDGSATGSGFDTFIDSGKQMNFTLRNAHVDGALLSATKVYDNGQERSFEAVFVNRTSRSGTRPDVITTSETKFGIGFVQYGDKTVAANNGDSWTNRVFLEKK